jgi:MoxR-like ATPase
MARQAVELVQNLRTMDLRKSPSISETLDWAKALVALNAKNLDKATMETTLSVLLKHESDLQRARRWLDRRSKDGQSDQDSDFRSMRWRN